MEKLLSLPAVLWDSLFNVHQPRTRYLGRALLLDLPVTFAIGALVALAVPGDGPDFTGISAAMLLPLLCVIAPLTETVMMAVIFALLRLITRQIVPLAILSTLIWMGLHSLGTPAHGLGIFWSFFIQSICYLRWETRSLGHAFWMTAALHALHNLPPALLLLSGKIQ